VTEDVQIHIPEPEGHRRAALNMINGSSLFLDAQPEEIAQQIEEFLASDRVFLEVRDAQYGAPLWITRTAFREAVLSIGVAWLQKVAPRPSGRVAVARELPRGGLQ